jgi:hypothetical protein
MVTGNDEYERVHPWDRCDVRMMRLESERARTAEARELTRTRPHLLLCRKNGKIVVRKGEGGSHLDLGVGGVQLSVTLNFRTLERRCSAPSGWGYARGEGRGEIHRLNGPRQVCVVSRVANHTRTTPGMWTVSRALLRLALHTLRVATRVVKVCRAHRPRLLRQAK